MELRQFILELRSRNVYRTAAVYLAGAWALLQVADVVFPVMGLPDWSITAVLVLAAVGFPIALVLSWLFELTPDNEVQRDQRAPLEGNISAARIIELTLVLLLCGLVGYLYVGRLAPSPDSASSQAEVAETSIAVLPFVNLSDDRQMDYLGDGLAEEILNLLARLNELQVASRTSSFYFKGKDADIQAIGQKLGVAHVLEGSVRVAGDKVRVTAQLIKSDDGFHVWSQTYDRPLDDVLAFQDAIASAVVDQLQLLVSPESRGLLARETEIDPEAYDYYLRARAYLRNPGDPESLRYAQDLFGRAIAVDPDYAEAFAGQCEALLALYAESRDPQEFESAEVVCQRALTLDRRSPGVYVALGNLYLASGQYGKAVQDFQTAVALKENQVEAYLGMGDAYLQQGQLVQAEEMYREALGQPGHWRAEMKMGNFLFMTGRNQEAIPYYRRISELMPDSAVAFNNLGAAYMMNGEFQEAVDVWQHALELAPSGLIYANMATSMYLLGRYDEAIPLYHQAIEQAPEDYELWGNLGDAYRHASTGRDMAGPMYRNAIKLAEQRLAVNASDSYALALLGHYHAALGNREQAVEALERAVALNPEDMYVHYSSATALATLGEPDRAISALEQALDRGFPMQLALSDANLKELKELPRFEASMAQRE